MIVGFGTGRCGTVSLSEQLHTWHEFKQGGKHYLSELDGHDKTAWFVELAGASKQYGREYGDISLDHINSLDYWLNEDVTRICLMRDREATVNSLEDYFTRVIWQRLFPQFDFEKRDDLYRFYDWYYDTILKHEDKFIIISPDQLEVKKNVGSPV